MEFFPEIPLDARAAETIARGLFAVANVDGMHERELALIGSFWADAGGGHDGLAALERGPAIPAEELAASLRGEEGRLFLKTALLLAYADGVVSDPERQLLERYARALGHTKEDLYRLDAEVKEFLLGHVSHLANTQVVAKVARKLGV